MNASKKQRLAYACSADVHDALEKDTEFMVELSSLASSRALSQCVIREAMLVILHHMLSPLRYP